MDLPYHDEIERDTAGHFITPLSDVRLYQMHLFSLSLLQEYPSGSAISVGRPTLILTGISNQPDSLWESQLCFGPLAPAIPRCVCRLLHV
jgi:hypothetical protein